MALLTSLYLCSRTVYAAVGTPTGSGARVVAAAQTELPEGCLINGVITNEADLTAALKEFFTANKLPMNRVALIAGGSQFMHRILSLPAMSEKKRMAVLSHELASGGAEVKAPLDDYMLLSRDARTRVDTVLATRVEQSVIAGYAALAKAAELINSAKRPVVYFGGGVAVSEQGCTALRALIEKADMPATYTLMAAGVLNYGDARSLGLIGMHGTYTANKTVDSADLVLAIGTRFSDRVALNPGKFAANAQIVQIDIDASEVDKNVPVALSVVGDAAVVLKALLPLVKQTEHREWFAQIAQWQANDYQPKDSETVLKPHQIIREVCDMTGPDTVYVTDVGQHQMWAAQYVRHAKPRGFLTSGGLGTMGYGYGAAIGAQVALGKNQRVIHFTGDGSFHMNLKECCTAVSYELPIITVIFNNQVLGMVRQWQTVFYGKRYSSTDPHRKTNYVKLAEGFGAKGYHCETMAQFRAAMAEALHAPAEDLLPLHRAELRVYAEGAADILHRSPAAPAVRRRKMAEVLREPWLRGLLRTLKAEKSYSPYYLPCLWRSRLLLNALYCSKFHGKSWLFGKLDWAGYYLFLGKRRR